MQQDSFANTRAMPPDRNNATIKQESSRDNSDSSVASASTSTDSNEDSASAVMAGVSRSLAVSLKTFLASKMAIIKLQLKKVAFQAIRKKSVKLPSEHMIPTVLETKIGGKSPKTWVKEIIGKIIYFFTTFKA